MSYRSLHRPSSELSITPYRELTGESGVLFFAGCSTAALYPGVLLSFLQLMNAAQEPVTMLAGEECCGQPLAVLGYTTEAADFARALAGRIEEVRCHTVVCGCPECVYMLRERYAGLGVKLKVRVLHTAEYLVALVEEGRLRLRQEKEKITFHDPCYLGRYLAVYDLLRAPLLSGAGLGVVEMERNGALSACCGGGFPTSVVLPELATRMAERRLADAVLTGAATLATACPHCLEMFTPLAEKSAIQVKDFTELLADRLD